ncbi:stl-1, partial [Pristionchus pacificus]
LQSLHMLARSLRSARLLEAYSRTRHVTVIDQNYIHATNTIINFVPHQEAWVVERMGKFHKVLEPGINVLIPVFDKIKYVQSLKEMAIQIPQQGAVTLDNVQLHLDGVLYLKVFDPYKASYGVADPEFAITQLAQTTMRSEVGKMSLDEVFKEREQLNVSIVHSINNAARPWGISCLRYEIRDMTMPAKIQEAMQMQVEAERRKRATVLESEGLRDAVINKAQGDKMSRILDSEANEAEQVNMARGAARAVELDAEARAKAIHMINEAISKGNGDKAASLVLAERYIDAFSHMAKTNNTMIVPAGVSEPASMLAQALSIYGKMSEKK